MMQTVAVARNAMATRFEIVLHGENPVALHAAGEEALEEIDRIEAQLSLYRPTSEVSRLNAKAAREPVRVTPDLFRLFRQAQRLSDETGGAFDITVAPLVRCWGFMGGTGKTPAPETLAEARSVVGMNLIKLNEKDFTVQFTREGMMLDFGAIGKGYAVERAADLLREAGVTSALVNGGTSTVYALGKPPGSRVLESRSRISRRTTPGTRPANIWPLCRCAMKPCPSRQSGASPFNPAGKSSAMCWIRATANPPRAMLAAVALPSAMETDALSTALLIEGEAGIDQITALRPGMRALVANRTGQNLAAQTRGIAMFVENSGFRD